MKQLKAIAAIVLSAILALAVVGCGRDGGRNPSGGKTDAKTLTIWIQPQNQPEYFMGWFENAFETKNPDINLNFVAGNNLGVSLATSLKAFL